MSDLLFDPNSERAKDFFADIASQIPDEEFYQNHLNRVSRSFAACIAELNEPLRPWVAMTYLLCRWLDTIEDAAWPSAEAQELAFSDFVTFFEEQLCHEPNQQSTISPTCTAAVLALENVTEAERALISDSALLIAKYSQFPERVREIIACLVIDMASGMSHFALNDGLDESATNESKAPKMTELTVAISQHTEIIFGQLGVSPKSNSVAKATAAAKSALDLLDAPAVPVETAFENSGTPRKEVVRLKSLRELNQYCFFVAGIVGEALTDLLDESACLRTANTVGGHAFGLFLQKINVLKDQYKDEAEGRFFVSNRIEVIDSLLVDAKLAFEYIMNVPVEQQGYRKFCSWSYFLGLATLPLLMMQTPEQLEPKLERDMVAGLFNMINSKIDSNEQLLRLYFDLTDQIAAFRAAAGGAGAAAPVAKVEDSLTAEIPAWVTAAYGGRLTSEQLLTLGL